MEFLSKLKILAAVIGTLMSILLVSSAAFALYKNKIKESSGSSPMISLKKPLYQTGQGKVFPAHDFSKNQIIDVHARCAKVSKNCYIFIQDGLGMPNETVQAVAKIFDEDIYPGYSDVFSRQLSPGLNADYRVTILFLDKTRAYPEKMRGQVVKGFYWQINELNQFFNPRSTQSRVIYIFSDAGQEGVEDIISTVQHETEHLKNWTVFKNNIGLTFVGVLSLTTLFTIYLALSHLYFKFMEARV